eukprot:864401-Pyramimonas_sp.AAC.1
MDVGWDLVVGLFGAPGRQFRGLLRPLGGSPGASLGLFGASLGPVGALWVPLEGPWGLSRLPGGL